MFKTPVISIGMENQLHEGKAVKWFIETHLGYGSLSNFAAYTSGERDPKNTEHRKVYQSILRITGKKILKSVNERTIKSFLNGTEIEDILRVYQLCNSGEKKMGSVSKSGNINAGDNTSIKSSISINEREILRKKTESLKKKLKAQKKKIKNQKEQISYLREIVKNLSENNGGKDREEEV